MNGFTGWPPDATAFLAEIDADNTREFWTAQRHRHATAVHAPMQALATALEVEFGPVRVLRPYRNRRFLPGEPPYRTDTGGLATSAGGAVLGVVLSATALTVSAGIWSFDRGQTHRFRAAIDGPAGPELSGLLAQAAAGDGLAPEPGRSLTGNPRGHRGDHPLIALLRMRGLQLTRSWPAGEWLATDEPLHRVRGRVAGRRAGGRLARPARRAGRPGARAPPTGRLSAAR